MKDKKTIIKILTISFVLIVIIVVGFIFFRHKTIECKSIFKEDNYTITTDYKLYNKNNNVYKVVLKKEIVSKNNTILDYYSDFYEKDYIKDKKMYGGYTVKKKSTKGKEEIDVVIEYNKMNLKKYLKKNKYLDGYINKDSVKIDGIYKIFDINEKMCN